VNTRKRVEEFFGGHVGFGGGGSRAWDGAARARGVAVVIGRIGLALCVWLAFLAGSAGADVRYVSVDGSKTDTSCSMPQTPCDLQHAVTDVVVTGDEVVVGPGTYVVPRVQISVPIDIHGAAGQPRPTITCCSIPFETATVQVLSGPGVHLHDLVIERTGGGLAIYGAGGAILERLVVRAIGAQAMGVAEFGGTRGLLRDSLVTATGANAVALGAQGAQGGLQVFDLRNVTAIAQGSGSIGLSTSGFFDGFSTRSRRTTLTNSIVRGDAHDVSLSSDSQGAAVVAASHSNYRAATVNTTGPLASLVDGGGNQTTVDPLFVNAPAADFREQPTSPTVDAGTLDTDLGGLDLDGNARTQGSAPDIGAFETARPVQNTLTVSKAGSGAGSVRSSPAGIDCGSACSHAYDSGSTVTLTATAAAGSAFTGWSGACSGSITCTLTLTADRSTTASFTLTPTQPPALSALRISPATFALTGRLNKGRCVTATRANRKHRTCTRRIVLMVSYRLAAPARVTITIERILDGRTVKGHCVAPTRANRKNRRCTRLSTLPGAITRNGGAGSTSFTFNGRTGARRLGPGTYQLTATPTASGRTGRQQRVTFQIAP
jgi:Divergent InlB B-repeat domain